MLLAESVLKLIFLHSKLVDPLDVYVDQAVGDFEYMLGTCDSIEEINEVLRLEFDKYLPLSIVVDAYERFLTLKRENPIALRSFAEYLMRTLPEWEDYASVLIEEAEMIEYKNYRDR